MRSIVWFWSTGVHDPSWVQAVAALVLVVLTLLTLAVLAVYAWDTHTLAKTSVEQIRLVKDDRDTAAMRNYYIAVDCLTKVQNDLMAIAQTLVENTFGTVPQSDIYPNNWPDVSVAFAARSSQTINPGIGLGIKLRNVDFAVQEFLRGTNSDERRARHPKVANAVNEAIDASNALRQALEVAQAN